MDDPNKPATPPDTQLADALRLQLPLLYTQANGLIASANPPLLELLGYGPDEVLGHHCSLLLASPEEMAGSACLLGDLARKKVGYVQVRKANGDCIWMDVTCLSLRHHPEATAAAVAILREADERISQQRQLDGHIKALLTPR